MAAFLEPTTGGIVPDPHDTEPGTVLAVLASHGESSRMSYQQEVSDWAIRCFGEAIATDKTERAFRFLEESLEVCQSLGVTEDEAHNLVSYVFNRPLGVLSQEVGGVTVTLAALCSATDIELEEEAKTELARCEQNTERIRAKHNAKPVGIRTSLPGLLP